MVLIQDNCTVQLDDMIGSLGQMTDHNKAPLNCKDLFGARHLAICEAVYSCYGSRAENLAKLANLHDLKSVSVTTTRPVFGQPQYSANPFT